MRRSAVLVAAVLAGLPAVDAASAQSTDLSYRAAQPLQLHYASTDTMSTVMDGMPMGSLTSTMNMVLSYGMGMEPLGDSTRVRLTTEKAEVTVQSMGQTQRMDEQFESPPAEFVIGRSGLSDKVITMGEVDIQTAMSAGIGQAAAGNLLLVLPARELRVGESWTDTLRYRGSMSELNMDGTSVIRGSYVSDTTIAGGRFNVLSYVTTTSMTTSGTMQGAAVEQEMTGDRTETVLWDPARRVVVRRQHTTSMTMKMNVPMAGGSITVSANGGGSIRLIEQ